MSLSLLKNWEPQQMRNYAKFSRSSFGGIHKEEKMKDVRENTLAPSNIKGLQVNRVKRTEHFD